ncbi:uncharacterized protein LOC101845467 isoform X2 [Aplysia californica]|nr:uncharacterized protein LOC101845467 isoform X2 [Aplysia californica]
MVASHMLYFIQDMRVMLLFLFSVSWCILAALGEDSSSHPIILHLVSTCNNSANLSWSIPVSSPFVIPENSAERCALTYFQTGEKTAQIIDMYLEPHYQMISLFDLSERTSYTAFVVCGGSYRTNDVTFQTEPQCHDFSRHRKILPNATQEKEEVPVVSSYDAETNYDAIEWPLGIVFAVVGVIICAVAAFYMWKKYQRRQRILRIFRQGQNDPFQALYSPTQDSYSF